MKPKPEPELHRCELIRVLAAALARIDPGASEWLTLREENFRLVSWTSLLYSEPRDLALDLPGIERLLVEPDASARDRLEIDTWQRRLRRLGHLFGDSFPVLWPWLASADLRATLDTVVAYLDNADGTSDRIRGLLIEQLESAWSAGERILLIGHSLGSVIAYDCLWQLSRRADRRGRVELLMTLGSPLATRFIRKGLLGAAHSGPDRFPDNIDRWVNVSARGDLVALHPRLKPFFSEMLRHRLIESIEDQAGIYNHFRSPEGLNPHKSYGYLNHAAVSGRICRWLGNAP